MKRFIAIISLCVVLIPVFTYAGGKTAQRETLTGEQGEPCSLVTPDNANAGLCEAPSLLSGELRPLVVAQQKVIEPQSKTARIRKLQRAPIR